MNIIPLVYLRANIRNRREMQLVKGLDIISFKEHSRMVVIVFNSLNSGSVEKGLDSAGKN